MRVKLVVVSSALHCMWHSSAEPAFAFKFALLV